MYTQICIKISHPRMGVRLGTETGVFMDSNLDLKIWPYEHVRVNNT